MRFFAKKGDANFRALTANLREKYSRYSRLSFREKKRGFGQNSSSVPPLYFISLLRIVQMQIHPAILSH